MPRRCVYISIFVIRIYKDTNPAICTAASGCCRRQWTMDEYPRYASHCYQCLDVYLHMYTHTCKHRRPLICVFNHRHWCLERSIVMRLSMAMHGIQISARRCAQTTIVPQTLEFRQDQKSDSIIAGQCGTRFHEITLMLAKTKPLNLQAHRQYPRRRLGLQGRRQERFARGSLSIEPAANTAAPAHHSPGKDGTKTKWPTGRRRQCLALGVPPRRGPWPHHGGTSVSASSSRQGQELRRTW